MTQKRLERRLSKRVGIRVFKRTHSQSADGDTAATDTDDTDERSGDASHRPLRRRVLSPIGGPVDWEYETSCPEPDPFPVLGSPQQVSRQAPEVQRSYASVLKHETRWFPDTLRDVASQDLETPFQGGRDGTSQRVDTTGNFDPYQSSHAPPGHVDADPVHYDALQAPDLQNQGKVIPCPLKQQNGCSGKDANMASLE
jgi:hypothetical protein